MSDNHYGIRPEDYVEPRCVLCGDPYGQTPQVKSIPQQRIIQKMDEYMAKRDYAGAWPQESRFSTLSLSNRASAFASLSLPFFLRFLLIAIQLSFPSALPNAVPSSVRLCHCSIASRSHVTSHSLLHASALFRDEAHVKPASNKQKSSNNN